MTWTADLALQTVTHESGLTVRFREAEGGWEGEPVGRWPASVPISEAPCACSAGQVERNHLGLQGFMGRPTRDRTGHGTLVTLQVPDDLARRWEREARAAGLSMQAWIVARVERAESD